MSEESTTGRLVALVRAPALPAIAVAVLGGIGYLAAPLMGGDLSAQMAHADFARSHPLTPVDFRWFSGTITFGYSLWTPPLMALIGSRVLSVVAAVVASWAVTRLLQRAGARRPAWGGMAAAVCQLSSTVEGRTTFNVGMALGLCALLAMGRTERRYRVAMIVTAVLAGAASPVAALLLWVCAAARAASGKLTESVVLVVASGVPVALVSGVFGDGGTQVFISRDFLRVIGASLLLILAVPRRQVTIRLGTAIGLAMVVGAYYIPSPVGANAIRLTLLFTFPVVVAFGRWRRLEIVAAAALVFLVQPPITYGTIELAGDPATHQAYYRPLAAEIDSLGPVRGRVEVPEITGHWDDVFLARTFPLARGWLRQTDEKLNKQVFYDGATTSGAYHAFLRRSAVQYVAVPDAALTLWGSRETTLIDAHPPYLQQVWRNQHWTLYAVRAATPVVGAPGVLLSYSADRVWLDAPAHATVAVRLRWFRWLSVSGPDSCIARSGASVSLHTGARGGHFSIGSTLPDGARHC